MKPCVHMHKYIYTRVRLGACSPQEILVFRLPETASGAFSGTVSLVFIERFLEKRLSTDVVETGIERLIVAISRGGRLIILSRGQVPPAPLNEPQHTHTYTHTHPPTPTYT